MFAIALALPYLLESTTADFGNLMKSLFFIPYEKENGLVQPVLFLGWTLNYEMYFYLVFQLALWINRPRAALICSALIAVLPLLKLFLHFENTILRFYSRDIVFEFLYGVALYQLWRGPMKGISKTGVIFIAAAFSGLALLLPLLELENRDWEIPRGLVLGIPASLMVAIAVLAEKQVIVPRAAVALGNASYSLYLLHPYVILLADKILHRYTGHPLIAALAMSITAGLCVAAALLSYHVFEKPVNNLGKRLMAGSGNGRPSGIPP